MQTPEILATVLEDFYRLVRPDMQAAVELSRFPYCDFDQALLLLTTQVDESVYRRGPIGLTRFIAVYKGGNFIGMSGDHTGLDMLLVESARKFDRKRGCLPLDLSTGDREDLGRVVVPKHLGWVGVGGGKVVTPDDARGRKDVWLGDVEAIIKNLARLSRLYVATNRDDQAVRNALWGVEMVAK